MISENEEMRNKIQSILKNIEIAVSQSTHKQKGVRLVAVSKTKPVELLQSAYDCGIKTFGENYVDELVEKYDKLPSDIQWHFIGHLQSNKINKVLQPPNLEVIETVDSIKLASKLNNACKNINRSLLKVYIQVRTSDEDTKNGVKDEEFFELAEHIINECSNLKFAGLMTIGASGDIGAFKTLYKLREEVAQQFKLQTDELELSMGMSADYVEAIQEGATSVRVGSSIFGAREYKK